MQENGRERLSISPATALITASGTPTDFVLVGHSLHGTVRMHCSAGAGDFNDLGEGIRQTLHGTCSMIGQGRSSTMAGIEYRNL